jgi:hypothetical protein
MKEIAKKLLDAPFNAGRIPEGNVNGYLTEIARDYLHEKYRGKDVEVNDYLNERDELFVALFSEFSYIKA